jgi:hypothetical protein
VAPPADYETRRDGKWKLVVRPEIWNPELRAEIFARVAAAPPQKHPRTLKLGDAFYLKIYSPPAGAARVKGFFRDSKALRALKQSEALARAGFHAPPPLAAGEERIGGALSRSFLLTRAIAAVPLAAALGERFAAPLDRSAARTKRQWIERLAGKIRRLHEQGFVHGDLVVSNVFVALDAAGEPMFFFMDHDRTRRYPRWLPQRLWRRNLVQLNRFLVPGISVRDRVRFLRFYLAEGRAGEKEYRLRRWTEKETRRRYGPTRKPLRSRRTA